jgi:glycerophosphoryl diester phosphodiesterase
MSSRKRKKPLRLLAAGRDRMTRRFDLQGHRGARGLKPENTLPAFEIAFDLGVTSVETDVRLTRDGVPVLFHDDRVGAAPINSLTLAELRGYRADRNPDPARFPQQDAAVTPLARWFAERHGLDPFAPPRLAELFAFAADYAGELGRLAGKTATQRQHAASVRFDLELKYTPFRPQLSGDVSDSRGSALLEERLLEIVRAAGMIERTSVRSFDHRCMRALRQAEPRLTAGVLIAGTAPVAPADLVLRADAQVYCPDFEFLDQEQVRQCHAAGIRVVPWTVNEPADGQRLLDWGVDGITTDYPDRFLIERG